MVGSLVVFVSPHEAGAAPAASAARLAPRPNPALVRAGGAAPVAGAASPRARHGWSQANEITGASGGLLGWSIAVSGSTMVVGAPYDNSGTGAAYVYTGSGTSWSEVAELTPTDGVNNDEFGVSVAITPGVIVVGAQCHSAGSPTCEGAAYVFTGSGSSWTQQAELDDPGQTANDYFGWPVVVSSNSILIAATGEDASAGAIFVYGLASSHWAKKAEITDPGNTAGDLFGFSTALSGKNLVVGAPGTTGSKGAAYVFRETRGGWIPKATLTASNSDGCSTTCGSEVGYVYGDYFGDAVAFDHSTILVGAPYASYPTPKPDGVGSGTAYVFTGSGATWTQKTELADPAEYTANDASPPGCTFYSDPCAAEDYFGFEATLLGSTVVVTAPYDSQGFPNNATGAAFAIPKSGGTWPFSGSTELTAGDGAPGDYFGWSGLTTIGKNILVVGSPYSPNGGIYFFRD